MEIKHKALFSIFAVGFLLSSCFSIKYSFKGAGIPPEVKTVSVQFIDNKARIVEPGLDQHFTEALKDYLQSNTNLFLVNGIGNVDFEGEITTYDYTSPVAITSTDVAAQNRFTIAMRVKFTNSVDPEQDFDASFSRYRDYASSISFESVKDDLTDEIMKELLDDIFNKAFVNW